VALYYGCRTVPKPTVAPGGAVMEQLVAARDELLYEDDGLVGRARDVKGAGKRLRHKLPPRTAWRLFPLFQLYMPAPKAES
jgi:hypothetical protein